MHTEGDKNETIHNALVNTY